jgi:hypothetical protein
LIRAQHSDPRDCGWIQGSDALRLRGQFFAWLSQRKPEQHENHP